MIQRGAAHDSTELSGHAMMLSCPPHSYIQDSLNDPDMQYPLQVPTVPRQDFDVMMHSNTTVDMNGEINPVAALLMIRRDRRFPTLTEAELNTIKDELADKSRCYGYFAVTFLPLTPLSRPYFDTCLGHAANNYPQFRCHA